jgi:hypothetical protein
MPAFIVHTFCRELSDKIYDRTEIGKCVLYAQNLDELWKWEKTGPCAAQKCTHARYMNYVTVRLFGKTACLSRFPESRSCVFSRNCERTPPHHSYLDAVERGKDAEIKWMKYIPRVDKHTHDMVQIEPTAALCRNRVLCDVWGGILEHGGARSPPAE